MTKDEIKNRISMALKDPVLQQGFEILCKENTELMLGKDMKVRIVLSKFHQGKYSVEYRRFLFWRKGFTYYNIYNDESGCTVFSK